MSQGDVIYSVGNSVVTLKGDKWQLDLTWVSACSIKTSNHSLVQLET